MKTSSTMLLAALVLGLLFSVPVHANLSDSRTLAREIRFALADHGRELTKAERRLVADDLVSTLRVIEQITKRHVGAGRGLVGLATSTQRLLDSTGETQLQPNVERRIERRLAHAAVLVEKRRE